MLLQDFIAINMEAIVLQVLGSYAPMKKTKQYFTTFKDNILSVVCKWKLKPDIVRN